MVSDLLAHDINNLLMIVAGCCERLGSQQNLTAEQRIELERIAIATNHAGWLTAQLMAASRERSGPPAVTELGAALGQGARLLEHALGDRISIEMRRSPEAIWVPLNDGEVTQILINLALNARDAMPDGGVLSVATSMVAFDERAAETLRLAPGEYVSIEVRDTGSGMSPETRARAFDRFFTTKSEERGGGLGLASVKRVVQQSGGTIDVRSMPGSGTRFTILLPVAEAPAAASSAAHEASTRARAGERVLIAEDEPVVRDIVASLLRDLGYETIDAASAAEALDIAVNQRIDLLLADVDLPDMSGRDLAERLAARAPVTRVLFMSGFNDERAAGLHVDAAFLQKPFTGSALGRKVRDVLDGTAAPAEP